MITVTCAIIRNEENKILIVQRGEKTDHPFKWEFPGGKLDNEESEEECIIREILEELSIDIVICGKLPAVEHDYGHKQIRLIPFICDTLDDTPFLSEHIAYKWINGIDLVSVDFSEADIYVASSYMEVTDYRQEEVSFTDEKSVDEIDIFNAVDSVMGRKAAEWIALSAIENNTVLNKLIEYSLSGDKRLSFRASWILTKVCDKFPDAIYPYLPQIIKSLEKLDNESTLRSFLRIISFSDPEKIEEWQQGILTEVCFNALNSGFSSIAVKAYAMEVLYKLTLIWPELSNELATSIILLMEDGTAGITSRGRAILKKLGHTNQS